MALSLLTDSTIFPSQPAAGIDGHGAEVRPLLAPVTDRRKAADGGTDWAAAMSLPLLGPNVFPLGPGANERRMGGRSMESWLARRAKAMAEMARDREASLRAALARERELALSLQATIFPRQLPEVPGYSLAAGYHAAVREVEVGGDFYDVFPLPDGRLGLLLGDVSGKGLSAAQGAAMARYTTRAYAFQSRSPGEVLTQVNAALCGALDSPERFVTAFYAVLECETNLLRYACAGHWPGILAGREGVEAIGEGSLALGIGEAAWYEDGERRLAPGDRLLLFTDGLVERPGDDPCRGMEAVRATLARGRFQSPERLVTQLHQEALRRNGGALRDDVALLALRCDRRR